MIIFFFTSYNMKIYESKKVANITTSVTGYIECKKFGSFTNLQFVGNGFINYLTAANTLLSQNPSSLPQSDE